MECPHNWNNCELCINLEKCKAGMYEPETESPDTESDLDIVIKAAEISECVVHTEAVKSVENIRGELLQSDANFWEWWGKSSPPDLHAKEPYKCMSGPTAPGGGGNCKVPKKPKKKIPEYLKTFGQ